MKKEILKVNKASKDLLADKIAGLKRIIPEAFAENKIDWEKMRLALGGEIDDRSEKYGLSWAGKSEAFRAIRIPATGTLVPIDKYNSRREQKFLFPTMPDAWDKTKNIFIEGDNLEALKLLQKHYREKIKMIYIDPPYNTGKDFIYKDNFTEGLSDYYERTGQAKDGVKLTSNLESNGRYHSDWLTMMYPRLFMARNLLREDGVIFISIDDNEVHNLRMIMDEIFGEENLMTQIVWKNRYNAAKEKHLAQVHEYILFYAKNKESIESLYLPITQDYVEKYFKHHDNKFDIRGPYRLQPLEAGRSMDVRKNLSFSIQAPDGTMIKPKRQWKWENKRVKDALNKGELEFLKTDNGWSISTKQYLKDEFGKEYGVKGFSLIENIFNQEGTKEINNLFGSVTFFPFPKPTKLIKHLMYIAGFSDDEVILDFFAGSGTTAHAVMDLNAEDGGNRKWICVQIPEEVDEKSEAKKAGFNTIAEIARERIRRAAEKIGEKIHPNPPLLKDGSSNFPPLQRGIKGDLDSDLGFKSFKLSKSNYRQWNVITDKDDEKKLKAQMKLFIEKPLVDNYDEKSVVYEILTKEGFDLNAKVSFIGVGNENFRSVPIWTISDTERKAIITFAKKLVVGNKNFCSLLGLSENDTFVCLDSALDDTTKVNLMRNYNIKVI